MLENNKCIFQQCLIIVTLCCMKIVKIILSNSLGLFHRYSETMDDINHCLLLYFRDIALLYCRDVAVCGCVVCCTYIGEREAVLIAVSKRWLSPHCMGSGNRCLTRLSHSAEGSRYFYITPLLRPGTPWYRTEHLSLRPPGPLIPTYHDYTDREPSSANVYPTE